MSEKSGFLFEHSFRTDSPHGTGKAVWLRRMPGRNPGEVAEEAPAPVVFSPSSHVDERRCMANHQDSRDRLNVFIPEKAAQHCENGSLLSVLVE